MKKKRGGRGAEAFRERYSGLFGDRWPALEAALAAEPDSVAFFAGEGLEPYYMDSASIFAASSLVLPPKGRILDACAAPGGKSLVLASRLGPETTLVANELSAERRRRLGLVLDRYLQPRLRERVEVTRPGRRRDVPLPRVGLRRDPPGRAVLERAPRSRPGRRPVGPRRLRRGRFGRLDPGEGPGPRNAAVGPPLLGADNAEGRRLPRLLDLRSIARGE